MYEKLRDLPPPQGLYDPAYEHDACGIGFVVNIKGKKSYAMSFELLNEEKTLEEKEISEVMNSLIKTFEKEFSAELRG